MKQVLMIFIIVIALSSCETSRKAVNTDSGYSNTDTLITQSLFNDREAGISEDNIQRILAGSYKLPQQLRVAIVKLDDPAQKRSWGDEDYIKNRQSYLDLFSEKCKQSNRVTKLFVIPDLLITKSPSFTSIREAAVRMQADLVVIYAINGDIYSKYKMFSKPDIKAYATTQLILLDVRTGLVPFSTIVSKDVISQKKKEEMDYLESRNRIQNEAVLLTINEIGGRLTAFLNAN